MDGAASCRASHRAPIVAMLAAMLADARRDHAKTYGMLIAARCRRDISNAAQCGIEA
ncbi:hypothetical protein [Burkholderia pseudomallei]|uniref:hypothetical protein n=1 Tax=Burkholderia pseudomallei TaxID=28450 RepID=UPI0001A42285|nr:hypothetical protein [Burkholderia pseudomallei]EEP52125.1 hypothetical protein GBP346_B3133 [Burkholderia pseudomallei MSHR346]EQA85235.1 hypothetical protein M218_30480 [Burkholderia pseudomallei MSHR338]